MNRGSVCHTLIQEGVPTRTCPECHQQYHESCWEGIGGCATYGCEKVAPAEKPEPVAEQGTGWGDSKSCPACGVELSSSFLVCSCGAQFPYADPMTKDEYYQWLAKQEQINSARRSLVILFVVCLAGVPAPVIGPIAGWYAFTKRKQLEGTGGTYLAMGYGTAALGATYALMMLALALGF